MGKTVPSYRMALEGEIDTWKTYRNNLTREEDVEAFDTLMDMARAHASAGGCAVNPVLFEPMVMSIVLELQLRVQVLESEFYEILWEKSAAKLDFQKTTTLGRDKGKP